MSAAEVQSLLQQAIDAAKSGDKGRARALLIEVTEADPGSEVAWMWRASVSLTPKDAAWCLVKVLQINPANRQAQDWIDKIRQLQNQIPAMTTRLVPPPSEARKTGANRLITPSETTAIEPTSNTSESPAVVVPVGHLELLADSEPPVLRPVTSPEARMPLPRQPKEGAHYRTGEVEKIRPELPPTAKIILVVDDNLTARRAITQVLESRGYRVVTATDGYEALAKLKGITPHLVVMDVALPGGMDGYQLCRQIRTGKAWRTIPVVMLSSRESLLDRVQSRLAGAAQYLVKPFKAEELVLTVRRHLGEV